MLGCLARLEGASPKDFQVDAPWRQTETSLKPCYSAKIKEIAKKAFCQLAVALLFISACAFFVSSIQVVASMAALALTSTLVMAAVESIIVFTSKRTQNRREKEIFGHTVSGSFFASLVDTHTRDLLLHESAHGLAAHLLFKESHPRLLLDLGHGSCSYYASPRQLTSFGRLLGYERSIALISGAGPITSILGACALIAVAHALPKEHIRLKCHLNAMAIQSVVRNVFYAISAIWSHGRKGHDFCALWTLVGIHPIVSALFLLALPITVKLAACRLKPEIAWA